MSDRKSKTDTERLRVSEKRVSRETETDKDRHTETEMARTMTDNSA